MERRRRDERAKSLVIGAVGLLTAVVAVTSATGWVNWAVVAQIMLRNASTIALFIVASLLISASIRRMTARRPRLSARSVPQLTFQMIAGAAAVGAVVAWGATSWLLSEANQAKDPFIARIEAIKTGYISVAQYLKVKPASIL